MRMSRSSSACGARTSQDGATAGPSQRSLTACTSWLGPSRARDQDQLAVRLTLGTTRHTRGVETRSPGSAYCTLSTTGRRLRQRHHHLARGGGDVVGAPAPRDVLGAGDQRGVDVAVLVDLPGRQRAETAVLAAAHEDAHRMHDVGQHLGRRKIPEGEDEGLRGTRTNRPFPFAMISTSTPAALHLVPRQPRPGWNCRRRRVTCRSSGRAPSAQDQSGRHQHRSAASCGRRGRRCSPRISSYDARRRGRRGP